MLLLGAVQLFEPVNGYQIRRELVSWRVDEWAHINPGSIYSGLETLARAGHLARHPLVEGSRTVTRLHDHRGGARRVPAALRGGGAHPRPRLGPRVHDGAVAAPLVDRAVFLGLLEERLAAVDAVLAEGEALAVGAGRRAAAAPAPADRPVAAQGRTERAWLVDTIAGVRAGSRCLRRRHGRLGAAGGRPGLGHAGRPRALPPGPRPPRLTAPARPRAGAQVAAGATTSTPARHPALGRVGASRCIRSLDLVINVDHHGITVQL